MTTYTIMLLNISTIIIDINKQTLWGNREQEGLRKVGKSSLMWDRGLTELLSSWQFVPRPGPDVSNTTLSHIESHRLFYDWHHPAPGENFMKNCWTMERKQKQLCPHVCIWTTAAISFQCSFILFKTLFNNFQVTGSKISKQENHDIKSKPSKRIKYIHLIYLMGWRNSMGGHIKEALSFTPFQFISPPFPQSKRTGLQVLAPPYSLLHVC